MKETCDDRGNGVGRVDDLFDARRTTDFQASATLQNTMAPGSSSSKLFTVQLAEYASPSSGPTHRSLRRFLLNVDVLKSAKISCGDVLIAVPQDPVDG